MTDAVLHFHTLTAAGWTLRSIAAHAGVDATSLCRYVRHGDDLPHVAAGILRIDPTTIADRTNHDGEPRVSRIGTVRRLRALQVMGWSARLIGEHVGKPERWVHNKIHQQGSWVNRSTHDLVVQAYHDLSQQRGPSEVTRTRALARGYVGPAQWEDIDLDEAPEQDEVEEWEPRHRQRDEDYEWLTSNGVSHHEALRRVGWTPDGYEIAKRRGGAA